MMKYTEMKYERVEYADFARAAQAPLAALEDGGAGAEKVLAAAKEFFALWQHYRTMHNLAYFRHTGNTFDEYYSAESDYYNAQSPRFEAVRNRFDKALSASPRRPELEKAFGTLIFRNIDISLRAFDEKIIGDMARENGLASSYEKLVASARINFRGEELSISQLGKYMASPDRQTRREAHAARSAFFASHAGEFDEIFDALVKCRDLEARKLGYKNFVELGYLRMQRNCYGEKDVARFRELVRSRLVPTACRIAEKQRARLGVDKLEYYDDGAFYPTGDPRPAGTPEQILENGRKAFRSLSPQTGEFFDYMMANGLFDMLGRTGKAAGGYSDDLPDFRAPFIFANFNGTSDDVNVLTHESGHAFHYYTARDIYPPDLISPTCESCEIHSMSMEFLTWPYMELFFGADADKYRYQHLSRALSFIPYGCAVDEFQHIVYSDPSLTPLARKAAWRELEKKYTPWVNYDGDGFFSAGGRWQRQLHIYMFPFYYIDYCLAQTCALEFFALSRRDPAAAFGKYLELCRLGGTDTFTGLLSRIGLRSPFEPGTLDSAASEAEKWLENTDDTKL